MTDRKGRGGTRWFPHDLEKKGAALSSRKTGIRSRESRSRKCVGKNDFPREREPKASASVVGHPNTWKSASVMSAPISPPLVTSNAE